jgi:hypothetical protein
LETVFTIMGAAGADLQKTEINKTSA